VYAADSVHLVWGGERKKKKGSRALAGELANKRLSMCVKNIVVFSTKHSRIPITRVSGKEATPNISVTPESIQSIGISPTATADSTVIMKSPRDSKIQERLRLVDKIVLFSTDDIPDPPNMSFSQDIAELDRIWDDSSPQWSTNSPLVIHGNHIPMKYWPDVYKYRSSKQWSGINFISYARSRQTIPNHVVTSTHEIESPPGCGDTPWGLVRREKSLISFPLHHPMPQQIARDQSLVTGCVRLMCFLVLRVLVH
jgi:hypothetical protein